MRLVKLMGFLLLLVMPLGCDSDKEIPPIDYENPPEGFTFLTEELIHPFVYLYYEIDEQEPVSSFTDWLIDAGAKLSEKRFDDVLSNELEYTVYTSPNHDEDLIIYADNNSITLMIIDADFSPNQDLDLTDVEGEDILEIPRYPYSIRTRYETFEQRRNGIDYNTVVAEYVSEATKKSLHRYYLNHFEALGFTATIDSYDIVVFGECELGTLYSVAVYDAFEYPGYQRYTITIRYPKT